MAIYKCKMCGGTLNVVGEGKVFECDSCGTIQTVPCTDSETIQRLYNRANTLRLKGEFDKAEEIYEKIIELDETQAEAYWGEVLCKCGVEYVEDKKTFSRIPTCHRTSYESVLSDENYQSALRYSVGEQREIYEKEAKCIDEIQKEIINISKKETPYDVFICYKETDQYGKRTKDSVIANEIYHQLIKEGFKVFYAAITLEDKIGREYEPIIFAALNSAKVMLVIATAPENYESVWVKNEWSRFLKFMKKDPSKVLIPCYRDMDAYDLPEEFARLQAQDMSKMGFINDIVRGIKKIVGKEDSEQEARPEIKSNSKIVNRIKIMLEDGEFSEAVEHCDKALDIEPENGELYLLKFLAKREINGEKDISRLSNDIDEDTLFARTKKYVSDGRKKELEEYAHIAACNLVKDRYQAAKINKNEYLASEIKEFILKKDYLRDDSDCQKILIGCDDLIAEIRRLKKRLQAARSFISAASTHAISLTGKGKVQITRFKEDPHSSYTTGDGCTDITCREDAIAVLALYSSTVIMYDDLVERFGRFHTQVKGKDFIDVAAGNYHLIALQKDGHVKGDYATNEEVAEWKDIVSIAALRGYDSYVGVRSDGKVELLEGNYRSTEGSLTEVSNWYGVIKVLASYDQFIGLTKRGTLYTTASQNHYLDRITSWSDIVDFAVGGDICIGLRKDGTVVAAVKNEIIEEVELDWTNVVALYSGYCGCGAICADGSVKLTRTDMMINAREVASWKNMIAISITSDYVLGLTADGEIKIAGYSSHGATDIKSWDKKLFYNIDSVEVYRANRRKEKKAKEEAEKAERELKEQRRRDNVCEYCGGAFVGKIFKKCSVCKRSKSY